MKIKEELSAIITSKNYADYFGWAGELLKIEEPAKVLAALLKYSFQDELDEKSYNEIKEVSIDKKGTTRLFVALGSSGGMTPRKLVDFIQYKTKVDSRRIQDVRIFENFSFITVPFEEAEIILKVFKKEQGGKRPIIEKARGKKRL
jgi:ATP-dependent RNA helicase DeaD